MMEITASGQKRQMTSRQIAETVGSAHESVLKTIRRLRAEGIVSGNETPYVHPQNGQTYTEFNLDYRDTMVVASGYKVELRAKIIDRWMELESNPPLTVGFKVPKTFADALRLAADQSETIAKQALQIEADAPKVAFAEAIRATEGVCSVEKIAKTLGWGRNKFFDKLRTDGILMANNLPYQKYIDREYFTVIEQEPYTDSKGVVHPTFTTRVTGAGQVFLAKKYANIMGDV